MLSDVKKLPQAVVGKTSLVQFTRQIRHKEKFTHVTVYGVEKDSMKVCKLLGVYLDQELRYKDPAREVAIKGLKAAMALKRLRGLQTHKARQLYQATVAPIVDYASPVWSPTAKSAVLKALTPTQRISASAITGSFKSVSLAVAEAEECISPTETRFLTQRARSWISMHSTPRQHPLRRLQKALDPECKRFKTPLEITAAELKDLRLKDMEIILPYCMPPWQAKLNVEIEEDKTAVESAIALPLCGRRDFFVDGSARNGKVGIGIYSRASKHGGILAIKEHAKIIGSQERQTAQCAELAGLEDALDSFTSSWGQAEIQNISKLRNYSDCKSALQALQNPRRQSGQSILRRILEKLKGIRRVNGPEVKFDGSRPMQG